MMTLESFEKAAEKVKEVTLPTNLIYSDYFSQMSGNKVYLKPENLQNTGAYKVRGAYYKASTLTKEELAHGLITGIGRQPCTGCCQRSQAVWDKGCDRYADDHAAD